MTWGAPPGSIDGWGWLQIELQNAEAVPRNALVEIETNGGQFQVRRALPIPAGGKATAWMPWIGGAQGSNVSISAPGHEAVATGWRSGSPYSQPILASISSSETAERLHEAIGKVVKAGLKMSVARSVIESPCMDLAADQVPDAWTYFTSVSLLHVDGTARGLDTLAPQRVIIQYVGAGGSMLMTHDASLPPGPLRDLVARAVSDDDVPGLRTLRHGLGTCWILGKSLPGTLELEGPALEKFVVGPAFEKFVADWQARTEGRAVYWRNWRSTSIGLGPLGFAAALKIPGLGELPVRLFFLLILAFGVLVGPAAYLTLRRRRQLSKMIWFVPAIGFGFAGAILLYGLFSEGLGTKGAVRSLTVLDQRTHEASGVHSRTLYAGVSLSGLRVSADTALFLVPDWRPIRPDQRIRIEPAEGGRWTGDVLPSRTPTAFRTVTQGRARERLRFRRSSDGIYELLAGEGFQPIDAPSVLLLHAFDGSWHSLERQGQRLTPLKVAEVADQITGISKAVTSVETLRFHNSDYDPSGRATYSSSTDPVSPDPPAWRTDGWIQSLVGDLPRGAYLGRMTSAPGFDDLGLDVEWLETRHLVMGFLAPEDVDG